MQDNHLENVRDDRPKSVVIDSVVRTKLLYAGIDYSFEIFIEDAAESIKE